MGKKHMFLFLDLFSKKWSKVMNQKGSEIVVYNYLKLSAVCIIGL